MKTRKKSEKIENFKIKSSGPKIIFFDTRNSKKSLKPRKSVLTTAWGGGVLKKSICGDGID
jgi:hypothetical protein